MQEIEQFDTHPNLIYINKEDLKFDVIRNAQDLNNYVLSKSVETKKNYIFIDEIQDIEEFEKALRKHNGNKYLKHKSWNQGTYIVFC